MPEPVLNARNILIQLGSLLFCSFGAAAQGYTIYSVAGNGLPPAGPALNASFDSPGSIAVDGLGNVYFIVENCVFKVDTGGTLTHVAGQSKVTGYSGDGAQAINA